MTKWLKVLLSVLLPFLFPTGSSAPSVPSATPTVAGVKGRLVTEELVLSQGLHRVAEVIDGDTIRLTTGETVRYIGIDTPEISHPQRGVECFGREAKRKNEELVLNQFVRLEKDVSGTDRYGRLLRYVYAGKETFFANPTDNTKSVKNVSSSVFVNETLVRNGYARAATFPPDVKYQSLFLEAEREARENKRGLWGSTDCINSLNSPNSSTRVFPTVPSPTGACKIKGNISYTTGEKIYHTPGCPYYQTTKINESEGERYFCSEGEAVTAGWRKAKNCP